MDIEERIAQLLGRLQETEIIFVEWETILLIRLGYPLARDGSLFLLTPDEELPVVQDIAAQCGLVLATNETLKPAYPCEFADGALRYLATSIPQYAEEPRPRLVFSPLSWAGLRAEELVAISDNGEPSPPPRTPRRNPPVAVPRNVLTVPLSSACTALARIAAREKNGSLKISVVEMLLSVLVYNLIDNSYEGDYEEDPPADAPLTDKERQEIDQAAADIRQWSLRPEDGWLKEEFIAFMTGKRPCFC